MKRNPWSPAAVGFVVIVLVYAALTIAVQRALPLFEGPDEPSHIQYIGFVSTEHRLPLLLGEVEVPGEAFQPPLYYLLMAPLFRTLIGDARDVMTDLDAINRVNYRGAQPGIVRPDSAVQLNWRPGARHYIVSALLQPLRVLRWPSLVFGVTTVTFAFLGMLAFGVDSRLALLGTMLVSLNPQFVFVSSYASNDALASAVGAACLWLGASAALAETAAPRARFYLLAGALAGIGVLTKSMNIPVAATTALLVFVADPRPAAMRLRGAALGLLMALGICGPYLAWNTAMYGDPLASRAVVESFSPAELWSLERFGGAARYFADMYWHMTLRSYWAVFGWMNVWSPLVIPIGLSIVFGVGLLGFALAGTEAGPGGRRGRWYLGLTCLGVVAVHVSLNQTFAQPQGRHLFTMAPHLALMVAVGLGWLADRATVPVGWKTLAGVAAGLTALNLYCLNTLIRPAYS